MKLSAEIKRIMAILTEAGFSAYVVGGSVRDWLLNRSHNDIDIATDALCEQMAVLFEEAGMAVHETGIKHGTITVVYHDVSTEITTFRVDGPYLDGRHPEQVSFSRNLEEDLARRDFTINAMAYSPTEGLIDPFSGEADIKAGVIRCVGDPGLRFKEDGLRILRALRLASQLGFSIEDQTARALHEDASLLNVIAWERIGTEFVKMLCGDNVKEVLLKYFDIIGIIVPELLPMQGFEQHNPHHIYDVLEHTAVATAAIPPCPELRLAALFHDSGKPSTYSQDSDGRGHFYGHPEKSAHIAHEVLARMRLSQELLTEVCMIVRYHDVRLEADEVCIRRWLGRLGQKGLFDLLEMKRADVSALRPDDGIACVPLFAKIEDVVCTVLDRDECFKLAQLALNGDDLLEIGISEGPIIGKILDFLLEQVIEGGLENTRDYLLAAAMKLWLIELLPDGFILASAYPEFKIEYVNERLAEMLAYDNSKDLLRIIKESVWSLAHPADYMQVRKEINAHGNLQEPCIVTYRALCKNGRELWVQQNTRNVINPGGTVSSIHFFIDATQQKETNNQLTQANAQYHEAQTRYETLINRIPGAVALYEYDHGEVYTRYISDGMCRMFGYTREGDKRVPAFALVHPDDRPRLIKEIEQAMLEGRDVDITHRVIREDSSLIWARLNASHTLQENGLPLFYALYTDVTLEHNTRELEIAYEVASRSNEARGRFLAQMSHEMRTPLNGIVGLLELMKASKADDALAYVDKAIMTTQHLTNLVNDILDLSRIDVGEFNLNPAFMFCQDFARRIEAVIMPLSQQRGIYFSMSIEPFAYEYFLVDVGRLEQVCINLLYNAVKFTDFGGHVNLDIKSRDCGDSTQELRFCVQDTGMGMSPELLEHIFEPFVQGNTDMAPAGSGLGLAIVKQLVSKMGGTVRISSEPGVGTTASFVIKGAGKHHLEEGDPHVAEQDPAKEAGECDFDRKHVLLVEDNEINQLIAQKQLVHMGFIVDTASNGREAVDAFAASPTGHYKVVFMDITMPVMNGLDAARAIRASARPDAQDVVLIAMTANAYAEDIEKSLASGMNYHLSKPWDTKQLQAVLEQAL